MNNTTSQDTQVQYRPFLVKEEKDTIRGSMGSKDNNEIINATKQVIQCVHIIKLM